ncbi:hypothetical protein L8S62_06720 [Enterobacter cloacae]|uniref:hypothetical protein n=1 Tax=Enterobacter cloacae TaxID=550 RepID=UPI0020040E96|nr:hypothetical protein [Enterobacter cloacae]MCK6742135.1 hypothetical protein [Enterobacter cloacae]MCK6782359.1 hypothetical protein [Enterobacter cloacae]
MKPSYEELELKLAESQREFRAADATIENLQMKLNAEREAKLALAAENAGLKAAVIERKSLSEEIRKAGRPPHTDFWHQSIYMADKKVDDALNSTPATDAFLAEVRAQGVEMAVDVVKQCYDNICAGGLQENREYEESIVQPHLDGIDDELKEIIAQLSQGERHLL